jgi:hypothetical protein
MNQYHIMHNVVIGLVFHSPAVVVVVVAESMRVYIHSNTECTDAFEIQ